MALGFCRGQDVVGVLEVVVVVVVVRQLQALETREAPQVAMTLGT